jgi:hypothetical protein
MTSVLTRLQRFGRAMIGLGQAIGSGSIVDGTLTKSLLFSVQILNISLIQYIHSTSFRMALRFVMSAGESEPCLWLSQNSILS